MFTGKLVRIGNSSGVVIPKELLREMKLAESAAYEIRMTSPNTLEVQFQADRDARVRQAVQDFVKEYHVDLDELSKK